VEKLATFVKSFTQSSIVTSQSSCSVCIFYTWTSFCISSPPTFFNSSNCPMNGSLIHNYIKHIVAQNMSTYRLQRMITLKGKHFLKKMYLTTKLFTIVSLNYAITEMGQFRLLIPLLQPLTLTISLHSRALLVKKFISCQTF
jgi:hypothetical protein